MAGLWAGFGLSFGWLGSPGAHLDLAHSEGRSWDVEIETHTDTTARGVCVGSGLAVASVLGVTIGLKWLSLHGETTTVRRRFGMNLIRWSNMKPQHVNKDEHGSQRGP